MAQTTFFDLPLDLRKRIYWLKRISICQELWAKRQALSTHDDPKLIRSPETSILWVSVEFHINDHDKLKLSRMIVWRYSKQAEKDTQVHHLTTIKRTGIKVNLQVYGWKDERVSLDLSYKATDTWTTSEMADLVVLQGRDRHDDTGYPKGRVSVFKRDERYPWRLSYTS